MRSPIRKPSIKKSVSSRTTGKATRTVRKITNPTYGKKGTGYIKDPKKAGYNKLYNQTSYGIKDVTPSSRSKSSTSSQSQSYKSNATVYVTNDNISDIVKAHPQVIGILRSNYLSRFFWGILLLVVGIAFIAMSVFVAMGCILICISLYLFYKASQYLNAYEDAKNSY